MSTILKFPDIKEASEKLKTQPKTSKIALGVVGAAYVASLYFFTAFTVGITLGFVMGVYGLQKAIKDGHFIQND